MDKEHLIKQIQDWTNRIPLVILGSGASVPYNLPTMWELGDHLCSSISFSDKDSQDHFDAFKAHITTNNDLEKALSEVTVNPKVESEIVSKTWELINQRDLYAYNKIIDGTHEIILAKLIKYLLNTASRRVAIVTTNYDRIAEYAACIAGAFICTGFSHNFIGSFSSSILKNNFSKIQGFNGHVNIWKVHGSLDWFKTSSEDHKQFPLIPNIPTTFIPSIVTPGISKYQHTHNEPYRTIIAQSDQEIEVASGFLCIGYGFNDEHVQPRLIKQIRESKPIIVITKKLTPMTKELIIGHNCNNYILLEEDTNPSHTKVYSSQFGEQTFEDSSYWNLQQYLTLVI
ncbi:SIR2 family protein [Pontibacter sp. E15-1]|uniref:SIR2 family protein n=1 Tax=Pontibacter sp. E15-1 TaxID=2919918 RepID=UPI001F501017|nr:SIR2 family protein [Pontibacter sp. E15-1]MCJ8163357.1 SIR2 family protein [Pontibacter sp. E15-1]